MTDLGTCGDVAIPNLLHRHSNDSHLWLEHIFWQDIVHRTVFNVV